MTYLEAKQTARRLFGSVTLHRGKNRCFVLRDGLAIGDGKSWLEALRSAGEAAMLKNAKDEAEAKRVNAMIEAFKVKHPDLDVEKLSEQQLAVFDAFTVEYDRTLQKTE